MNQFQNLLLTINDNDTDEEIIVKVKSIARKLKQNETNSSPHNNNINEASIETINKEQNLRSQTLRQKEFEKEINLLKNQVCNHHLKQ